MDQDLFEFIRNNLRQFGFKDKRVKFKLILQFIDGVIREAKKSINKYKTVDILETSVQSTLRWLKRHYKHLKKFQSWLYGLAQNNRDKRSNTYIIIDDTIVERASKTAYGVSKLFDHSTGQYVYGNCIVSLLISNQSLLLALDQKFYISQKTESEECTTEFSTKIKFGCELINNLQIDKTRAYVVIDAWYTSKTILDAIKEKELFCVLAFKNSKKVSLFGKEYHLDDVFDKNKLRYFTLEGEKYLYDAKILHLTGWGRYKVLMIKKEKDIDFRFFLTNKIDMKPINMMRHYIERWNVEQHYRDEKQHLGLKPFFMRSKDSTESYLNFVQWLFDVLSLYRYELAKEGVTKPIETIVDEYKKEFNKRTRDLMDISI